MSIDVAGRLTSTHADAEPVLRVEGLSVDFVTDRGWTRVVDGVDLSVTGGIGGRCRRGIRVRQDGDVTRRDGIAAGGDVEGVGVDPSGRP